MRRTPGLPVECTLTQPFRCVAVAQVIESISIEARTIQGDIGNLSTVPIRRETISSLLCGLPSIIPIWLRQAQCGK
eukprot:CAMPEP_0169244878 /NCGR_PEP_ID=MMETSP1016-20121227/33886_1 /TAXON_ID=342587 /ORGANISM="Karlodinium micrum, Strain CCMP2283" /LENGTH=75 /DNA_ID=CAMNT_0009325321 /DNA_START=624 /DNA_END=848 /DNA_ORIENTATION=+